MLTKCYHLQNPTIPVNPINPALVVPTYPCLHITYKNPTAGSIHNFRPGSVLHMCELATPLTKQPKNLAYPTIKMRTCANNGIIFPKISCFLDPYHTCFTSYDAPSSETSSRAKLWCVNSHKSIPSVHGNSFPQTPTIEVPITLS